MSDITILAVETLKPKPLNPNGAPFEIEGES